MTQFEYLNTQRDKLEDEIYKRDERNSSWRKKI